MHSKKRYSKTGIGSVRGRKGYENATRKERSFTNQSCHSVDPNRTRSPYVYKLFDGTLGLSDISNLRTPPAARTRMRDRDPSVAAQRILLSLFFLKYFHLHEFVHSCFLVKDALGVDVAADFLLLFQFRVFLHCETVTHLAVRYY